MHAHLRFLTVLLLLLVTTLAAVHPILSAEALRDRKALLPIEDSQVRSVSPDSSLGGRASELWVEGASDIVLSFLMFDLSQLPAGTTIIEEATMRLYANDGTGNGTVNLHYCPNNDWTEDKLTYNNKPAFQPDSMGMINVAYGVARWYEWNVTNAATSTLNAADMRLSLALDGYTTHGSFMVFNSRQSPDVDKRPELSVLYAYTPTSGIDPVLVALIVIVVVAAASTIGLIAYTRRKKEKNPHKNPKRNDKQRNE